MKQAFGTFARSMAGWNHWIVAWLDGAIYPLLANYYLSFFFPVIADGPAVLEVSVLGIEASDPEARTVDL